MKMVSIRDVMRQMIQISDAEMEGFLSRCTTKTFKKRQPLNAPGVVPEQIFFIAKGITRTTILDHGGCEHTIHFALEGQFIADYSNFLLRQPSIYTIEALETVEAVVLPRTAIEWGYQNLHEGERMGRLVAEFYFIFHDNFIRNTFSKTPKERYDEIETHFPNLQNRVPQHMIASFLGISPVHLSRLKKRARAHKT
jgi:CRP-like cAMP-binding protein